MDHVTAPHDSPTAVELVEAVREWIELGVTAGNQPPNPFHARVAANVLAIVEREIVLGPEQAERHRRRLARLGQPSDRALAEAIRAGSLDHRLDEVRELVWDSVRDKLGVANPSYLERVEG